MRKTINHIESTFLDVHTIYRIICDIGEKLENESIISSEERLFICSLLPKEEALSFKIRRCRIKHIKMTIFSAVFFMFEDVEIISIQQVLKMEGIRPEPKDFYDYHLGASYSARAKRIVADVLEGYGGRTIKHKKYVPSEPIIVTPSQKHLTVLELLQQRFQICMAWVKENYGIDQKSLFRPGIPQEIKDVRSAIYMHLLERYPKILPEEIHKHTQGTQKMVVRAVKEHDHLIDKRVKTDYSADYKKIIKELETL